MRSQLAPPIFALSSASLPAAARAAQAASLPLLVLYPGPSSSQPSSSPTSPPSPTHLSQLFSPKRVPRLPSSPPYHPQALTPRLPRSENSCPSISPASRSSSPSHSTSASFRPPYPPSLSGVAETFTPRPTFAGSPSSLEGQLAVYINGFYYVVSDPYNSVKVSSILGECEKQPKQCKFINLPGPSPSPYPPAPPSPSPPQATKPSSKKWPQRALHSPSDPPP